MRPSSTVAAVSLALCGAAIAHAFTAGPPQRLALGALVRTKGAAAPSARASRRRRGVASMYFFGQDMSEIELFSRQLEGVVVPLFDPLDDPIPVPFPYEGADMISYKFDQPAYLQMASDAIEKGLFGHIVAKAEAGTLVGAVGCICTVDRDLSEERTGALAVAAGVRFEVVEVVNSIPYATALVKVLPDEPYPGGSAPSDKARLNKAMDLEGETFRSLLDIIRLSAEMESRGAGGNNNLCPTSTLDTARARLDTCVWAPRATDRPPPAPRRHMATPPTATAHRPPPPTATYPPPPAHRPPPTAHRPPPSPPGTARRRSRWATFTSATSTSATW